MAVVVLSVNTPVTLSSPLVILPDSTTCMECLFLPLKSIINVVPCGVVTMQDTVSYAPQLAGVGGTRLNVCAASGSDIERTSKPKSFLISSPSPESSERCVLHLTDE